MAKTIYVDNAATTAMSDAAVAAMLPCLQGVYGNASSLHTVGQLAKEKLEEAREEIARCIGASAREIYFTSGGSESDNQAIRSAAYAGAAKGKKHIISTNFEHHAVLHTLKALRSEGFEVTCLPVDAEGLITPQAVQAAIRPDTALVTIMYANNEVGTILPIREIGAVCRANNVIFHTDAVQAVGHIPVDVQADNIDMLSLSAHKFHGPKGVGALYCRRNIPLRTFIQGGAQERGKRAGTENLAGICSMAAALKEACGQLTANMEHERALRDMLIEGLSKIPHSKLNGDRLNRLPVWRPMVPPIWRAAPSRPALPPHRWVRIVPRKMAGSSQIVSFLPWWTASMMSLVPWPSVLVSESVPGRCSQCQAGSA